MDVLAREVEDRRRFVIGRRGFHVLAAATALLAFAFEPRVDAIVIAAMMGGLVVAAHVVTRGADVAPQRPEDAPEVLRNRARARLRLGRVVRIAVVVFGLGSIALAFARGAGLAYSVVTAATSAALVWIGSTAIERRIRRSLE
jgi:hypothetical protein